MGQFAVFLVGYTLSQFFRSFLAVVAPELAHELALSAGDLGNISAAWFATFALAQIPVGVALDRLGPRRSIAAGLVVAAAGALLLSRAHSAGAAIAAMALIGAGCSPVYMGALYAFGRSYPPHRFALLSSWLIGLGSAGNLLAASPLAHASAALGWRNAFAVIAAVTLAAALVSVLLVRDPPPAATTGQHETSHWLAELGRIVTLPALWPLIPLMAVSYAIPVAERGLWIGPFLSDVWGLDAIARGHAALLMGLAMSLGALAYGPLDHWLGTRKWVVAGGCLITGLALLALSLAGKPSVATATALLAVIGFAGLSYGVLMAHARPLFPDHLLGRGITFCNLLFIGGAGLVQPISGRYMDALKAAGAAPAEAYARLHWAFGVVMLAATAVYVFSKEKR